MKKSWWQEGDKTYTVGVVEFTDDWSPFCPLPFDKVEEDTLSDESDDSDEGISNTWMPDNQEDEEEEGEIRPETDGDDGGNRTENRETDTMKAVGGEQNPNNCPESASPEIEKIEVLGNDALNSHAPASNMPLDIPDDNDSTSNIQRCVVGQPDDTFGPLRSLVSLECFGPFPNPFLNRQKNPPRRRIQPQNSEQDEPQNRKRKRLSAECSFAFNPHANLENIPNRPTVESKEIDPTNSQSLDMNRNPHSSSPDDICTQSSGSDEITKTVEIGNEIGFQIQADNCILAQATGEMVKGIDNHELFIFECKRNLRGCKGKLGKKTEDST
ncbi:hypothetical protein L1887_37600 [Cichorium endivia]|nr:hypothetical protein L1887_37600 [Cichorium endivia]